MDKMGELSIEYTGRGDAWILQCAKDQGSNLIGKETFSWRETSWPIRERPARTHPTSYRGSCSMHNSVSNYPCSAVAASSCSADTWNRTWCLDRQEGHTGSNPRRPSVGKRLVTRFVERDVDVCFGRELIPSG